MRDIINETGNLCYAAGGGPHRAAPGGNRNQIFFGGRALVNFTTTKVGLPIVNIYNDMVDHREA